MKTTIISEDFLKVSHVMDALQAGYSMTHPIMLSPGGFVRADGRGGLIFYGSDGLGKQAPEIRKKMTEQTLRNYLTSGTENSRTGWRIYMDAQTCINLLKAKNTLSMPDKDIGKKEVKKIGGSVFFFVNGRGISEKTTETFKSWSGRLLQDNPHNKLTGWELHNPTVDKAASVRIITEPATRKKKAAETPEQTAKKPQKMKVSIEDTSRTVVIGSDPPMTMRNLAGRLKEVLEKRVELAEKIRNSLAKETLGKEFRQYIIWDTFTMEPVRYLRSHESKKEYSLIEDFANPTLFTHSEAYEITENKEQYPELNNEERCICWGEVREYYDSLIERLKYQLKVFLKTNLT